MTAAKTKADHQHDRMIDRLEARDQRSHANITLPISGLRRGARSLASRADQILARKDRDPILRAGAETEAGHSRRLAAAITSAIREAA